MEHPIDSLMETVMKNIKTMVNVDMVIGEPVTALDSTVILPVSTVSFGFGAGGSEFTSIKSTNPDDKLFGGGAGGGATVKPTGFLIINGSNVRFMPISDSVGPADKIIDMIPGMVDKVNGIIASKKSKKKEDKIEVVE